MCMNIYYHTPYSQVLSMHYLRARSSDRPEKSKKLRYSDATSWLNSLLQEQNKNESVCPNDTDVFGCMCSSEPLLHLEPCQFYVCVSYIDDKQLHQHFYTFVAVYLFVGLCARVTVCSLLAQVFSYITTFEAFKVIEALGQPFGGLTVNSAAIGQGVSAPARQMLQTAQITLL